jgi:hypothetical protein
MVDPGQQMRLRVTTETDAPEDVYTCYVQRGGEPELWIATPGISTSPIA